GVISPLLANIYLARSAGCVVRTDRAAAVTRPGMADPLRGRLRDLFRAGGRCTANLGGVTQAVRQVWSDAASRQNATAVLSQAPRRKRQAANLQLSGVHALLGAGALRRMGDQEEDDGEATCAEAARDLAVVSC